MEGLSHSGRSDCPLRNEHVQGLRQRLCGDWPGSVDGVTTTGLNALEAFATVLGQDDTNYAYPSGPNISDDAAHEVDQRWAVSPAEYKRVSDNDSVLPQSSSAQYLRYHMRRRQA